MGERKPTEAELAILNVLWKCGPATVREVHQALKATQSTGYTTTLKLMQLMYGKNLLLRDDSHRSHVYSANVAAEEIQRDLVGDLIDRAFDGSATRLVMRALSERPTSQSELESIRHLLDELERGQS